MKNSNYVANNSYLFLKHLLKNSENGSVFVWVFFMLFIVVFFIAVNSHSCLTRWEIEGKMAVVVYDEKNQYYSSIYL